MFKENLWVSIFFVVLLAISLIYVYQIEGIQLGGPDTVEEPEETEEIAEEEVYQGTAEGYGGPLTVEVALENGEIVAIEIIEHEETEGFAEPAFEETPQDIIEEQSTDVDVVSGVTLTSEAIMEAVENALEGKGVIP